MIMMISDDDNNNDDNREDNNSKDIYNKDHPDFNSHTKDNQKKTEWIFSY